LVGERSDMYFSCPRGVTRIPTALPDSKVIVTIRDPFARCVSVWSEARCQELKRQRRRDLLDATGSTSSSSKPTFAGDFRSLLFAGQGRRHSEIVSAERNEDMHDFIGTMLDESRYSDFLEERWLEAYTLYTTDSVPSAKRMQTRGGKDGTDGKPGLLLLGAEEMNDVDGVKRVYGAVCNFLGVNNGNSKSQLTKDVVNSVIESIRKETEYDGRCQQSLVAVDPDGDGVAKEIVGSYDEGKCCMSSYSCAMCVCAMCYTIERYI